ncbi:MAG: DnaB-like helicase N-terminal domain-containing protein, partial [Planctomycetaceae bacterium]
MSNGRPFRNREPDSLPAGLTDKLPPQNIEAEQGVLGSILCQNEAIDEVAELLTPQHFYRDAHQRIFRAIMSLHERGVRGIDPVTLHDELAGNNETEDIGGADYLVEILAAVPHAAHVRYYADIVRDKWIQRMLTYACSEILTDCYEGGRDTEDILATAEQRVFSILESQEHVEKMDLGDILLDTFTRINARLEKDGEIS